MPQWRRAAQRWGQTALVVAMLLVLWGGILTLSGIQRQRLINESTRELGMLDASVAQQTASLFNLADTQLRTLELWLDAHPGIDPLSDANLAALVAEMRRASGGRIGLNLVSEAGQLHDLPVTDGAPRADVHDRDYFRVHQQAGAPTGQARQLFIGTPVISRVSGTWQLPVSWRLDKPAGRITVLMAAIELDSFVALHDPLRVGRAGTVGLVRSDGVVLSRVPFDPRYIGRNVSATPQFREHYGQDARGSFTSDGSQSDGIERLVSYQRLQSWPVTVLVSRGIEELLETYHSRRRLVLGISAVLTLVVLVINHFLQRSQHALQAAQRELRRLATTDELTGVMNRRAFVERAHQEFGRARRFQRPMAVLMLDLDHFKRVNDVLGHATGDRVLRECAERWKATLRGQDLLGRVGGEEFCVLLPETPPEAAAQVAERLRAVTVEHPIVDAGVVSVSIGLSCMDAADTDLPAVLQRADRALYQAKAQGRDRVRA